MSRPKKVKLVKIKLTKDCTWGKIGDKVEVTDEEAKIVVKEEGYAIPYMEKTQDDGNTTITSTTTTTTTTTPPTTTDTNNKEPTILYEKNIKLWGCYDEDNNIIIEKIKSGVFFYKQGNISNQGCGIVNVQSVKVGKYSWEYYILVPVKNGVIKYIFDKYPKKPLYFVPEQKILEEYIKGNRKALSHKKLLEMLQNVLKTMFEFMDESDVFLASLFILQSYLDKKLNAIFLASIDAKFGAGKTTILELICKSMLHGFSAGDISKASIPRLIDQEAIRIGIDELDQIPEQQREEMEQMLRRGQRRDNPYIRFNKNTGDSEVFDTFGQAIYTLRTNTEDALASRSISIHTKVCNDKRLSILNLYKDTILEPLCNELWLWYLDNIGKFGGRSYQVVEVGGLFNKDHLEIDSLRGDLYIKLTNFLSKKELSIFETLAGRNIEIAYLMLQIGNLLGEDFVEHIKKHLVQKQEDQDIPDGFYIEKFEEVLRKKVIELERNQEWILRKGDFIGNFYYPKNTFFVEFNKILKECEVKTIGTTRFNGILKDFGFVEGYNMKNQKHWLDKVSLKCLVFESGILKNIKQVDKEILDQDEEKVGAL